jgi:hypothetical protein
MLPTAFGVRAVLVDEGRPGARPVVPDREALPSGLTRAFQRCLVLETPLKPGGGGEALTRERLACHRGPRCTLPLSRGSDSGGNPGLRFIWNPYPGLPLARESSSSHRDGIR